jgi:hypothetical protein
MTVTGIAGIGYALSWMLPRWLRYTGLALAISITASGVVYLLLLQALAVAAGPALILLLLFITSAGLVLGGKDR